MLKDPELKKAVVSDPKGVIERHTGRKPPAQVKIFVHEEDANTLHCSIQVAPATSLNCQTRISKRSPAAWTYPSSSETWTYPSSFPML